jgi:hypothetical protein
MASCVAHAGMWYEPVLKPGTEGCSKMSYLALPCSESHDAVTSTGGSSDMWATRSPYRRG